MEQHITLIAKAHNGTISIHTEIPARRGTRIPTSSPSV
jgi:hypothetical protein